LLLEDTRLRKGFMRCTSPAAATCTYTSACCRREPHLVRLICHLSDAPRGRVGHTYLPALRYHATQANAATSRTSVAADPGTRLSSLAKRLQASISTAQCKTAGTTRLGVAETLVGAWGHPKAEGALPSRVFDAHHDVPRRLQSCFEPGCGCLVGDPRRWYDW
jgi:hypothetical protein